MVSLNDKLSLRGSHCLGRVTNALRYRARDQGRRRGYCRWNEGVVVCDFDSRKFAEGYEGWNMPTVELLGGGTLSSGIMIDTVEAGLVHYVEGSGTITRFPS